MAAPGASGAESKSFEAGLLLAAQVAGDRGAVAAVPGFATALGLRVGARAEALDALSPSARADVLRETAGQLRFVSVERAARLAPRARALLAAEVPRALGSLWQREAPAVRRGFSASAGVRAAVRAAAAELPLTVDPELAAREVGHGRALLAGATAGPLAEKVTAAIDSLDPAEAAAVFALRGLLVASDDAEDRVSEALLDAVRRASPPCDRVRALGAMALALVGDGAAGDVRSQVWRRIARELAAIDGDPRLHPPTAAGGTAS